MQNNIQKLSATLRHHILTSTTAAGSGHPSSCLSAVELMAGLFYSGIFKFDLDHPEYPNNDRIIFSKGHAAPLFYSLWAVGGAFDTKELSSLRKFGSRLEGHPTLKFPYTECATGSLGQGLSVGVGLAINGKYLDKINYRTFVLLGDSEMAEGSVWEALEIAAHYKLNNLIAVLDVNRLGQRGETIIGHHLEVYKKKAEAFGWQALVIDGHNLKSIVAAYQKAGETKDRPTMIIAKTFKGKGVSIMENKDGWHGKPLNAEQLTQALLELGMVDVNLKGKISKPKNNVIPSEVEGSPSLSKLPGDFSTSLRSGRNDINYPFDKPVSTRRAYGNALAKIGETNPSIVVLDAETSNSTYAELFKNKFPDRFFEMYIAEQNMVGTALGLSRRGKIPFVSTFSAFFSRAFDQIRMCQYSDANLKFCGSHAGVSIGEDGSSQMGLEDIALFRSVSGSVVFYPSDAVSTEKLIAIATTHHGLVYIRTTRADTAILYNAKDNFKIGGSKTLFSSDKDLITIIGAGITLHEARKAYEELKKENINIRLIDLYSVKPLDTKTLKKAAAETRAIITVEDHYPEGGIGEAVAMALATEKTPIYSLAVRKLPMSGRPQELLDYEEISARAIIKKVKTLLK
ncbi:MAG: transketolase [Patescibacteria group bacterium]